MLGATGHDQEVLQIPTKVVKLCIPLTGTLHRVTARCYAPSSKNLALRRVTGSPYGRLCRCQGRVPPRTPFFVHCWFREASLCCRSRHPRAPTNARPPCPVST